MTDYHENDDTHPPFWRTRYAVGWVVLGSVAAYFLLTQHLAHVMGALPYLLFLACPLMHVFMHHGHGHGHRNHDNRDATSSGGDDDRENRHGSH